MCEGLNFTAQAFSSDHEMPIETWYTSLNKHYLYRTNLPCTVPTYYKTTRTKPLGYSKFKHNSHTQYIRKRATKNYGFVSVTILIGRESTTHRYSHIIVTLKSWNHFVKYVCMSWLGNSGDGSFISPAPLLKEENICFLLGMYEKTSKTHNR